LYVVSGFSRTRAMAPKILRPAKAGHYVRMKSAWRNPDARHDGARPVAPYREIAITGQLPTHAGNRERPRPNHDEARTLPDPAVDHRGAMHFSGEYTRVRRSARR